MDTYHWTKIGVRKDLLLARSSGVYNSLHSQTCHRPHLGQPHKLQLEQLPEYTSVSAMVKLQSRPTGFRHQDPLPRTHIHPCHDASADPKRKRNLHNYLIGEIAKTAENGDIARAPMLAATNTNPSLCSLGACLTLNTRYVSLAYHVHWL